MPYRKPQNRPLSEQTGRAKVKISFGKGNLARLGAFAIRPGKTDNGRDELKRFLLTRLPGYRANRSFGLPFSVSLTELMKVLVK